MTVHGDVISHVNISHVMVEDGGEYTCTAENRAGKTSHSARLNVYGKLNTFHKFNTMCVHLIFSYPLYLLSYYIFDKKIILQVFFSISLEN